MSLGRFLSRKRGVVIPFAGILVLVGGGCGSGAFATRERSGSGMQGMAWSNLGLGLSLSRQKRVRRAFVAAEPLPGTCLSMGVVVRVYIGRSRKGGW